MTTFYIMSPYLTNTIDIFLSADGINWTKQNDGNPVIIPTKSWELSNVSYPSVIYDEGK